MSEQAQPAKATKKAAAKSALKAAKASHAAQAKGKGKKARRADGAKAAQAKTYVKPPLPEDVLATPEPLVAPSATGPLDVSALTGEQRAQIEKLSMNLARAALTAQGAI